MIFFLVCLPCRLGEVRKTALGIQGEVKLMQNHKIPSPMLVGLYRPTILLPVSNIREIDLKLVFDP